MFSIKKKLKLVFMFTSLQNANRKDSSWFLKENEIYVFNKKGMKNKISVY